ncbi:alkaline phosphatase family protein [uncultured Sphaerochaeta sp.]|uniref:alkaline phosphatase family protein n=1 Tax=uncultured Sphaerochaeta sp. TaxID=886478 RepID=UPI002A0A741F|nr:alkaline phosphatase family protein [uncultured Sphaerochaeta sp.]
MHNHVFVISIDALSTEDLKELFAQPHCKELLEGFSGALKVHSPYPSFTYPCHATIMTGCYPDKTGIFHNTDYRTGKWNWYHEDIKRPTLIDIIRQKGLTSGCVCWPVMGGAPSDYLIAEIWAKNPGEDPTPIFDSVDSPLSKPIFEKHKHLLTWMTTPGFDLFATSCTADIIKLAKPDLLCTHLSYLDHQKHQLGTSPTGLSHAYVFIDECLGKILEATKEAGILEQTTFVLLGDHGQKDIHTLCNLNALLKERGYYHDAQDWQIFGYSCGCSSQIHIRNIDQQQAKEALVEIQKDYPMAIASVMDRKDFQVFHLDGPFSFVLEAGNGYAFGKKDSILFDDPSPQDFSMANHGYLSDTGPEPPFIVCNKKSLVLDQARMVDEAPTILSLLEIETEGMDGTVLPIC